MATAAHVPPRTSRASAGRTPEGTLVAPVPGAEGSDELTADILEFAAGQLAKYKLPRTVEFRAELPRDPNGKLYKRRLL